MPPPPPLPPPPLAGAKASSSSTKITEGASARAAVKMPAEAYCLAFTAKQAYASLCKPMSGTGNAVVFVAEKRGHSWEVLVSRVICPPA